MAGQMDCRSVADMKDLVHCVCLVVFSDDLRRQFAKKLSLLIVITVTNDRLRNGGCGKTGSSRRFSLKDNSSGRRDSFVSTATRLRLTDP